MGKWTLEHTDEVLRNKFKSLVQGAIKRMKSEKEGPSISYEAFVESLEEGDSFTTSLIDVLVKEVADRSIRPTDSDKRLISERTAKSLRMQTTSPHIYRGSSGTLRDRARRSVPIPPSRPYSAFHDILSDSDGEEEYGTMLSSAGQLEGARLPTDLYEAFLPSTSTYDLPGSLSRSADHIAVSPNPPEPATTTTWPFSSPPPRSPATVYSTSGFATSGPAWSGLGGPGSTLSRQSTIRRPHRTRTVDVNDFASFTSRRRSAIRNTATQEDGPREASPADATGTSVVENSRSAESSATAEGSSRRSFDLTAWMARRRSSFGLSTGSSFLDEASGEPSVNPTSSQMWYSMTAAASPEPLSLAALSRRSSTADVNDDRRHAIAPRLRRGGLRPPESLLLQGPGTSTAEGTTVHRPATVSPHGNAASLEVEGTVESVPGPLTTTSISRVTSPPVESR